MKKIVIIGGGISGLSTFYYLRKLINEKKIDAEIQLVEKSGRFGGQIKTEYDGEFIFEGGSDCFIREKPWALKLCNELEIEEKLVNTREENSGTFIYHSGKLHPLPEGLMLLVPTRFLPFATTGLFSIPGKLRMAIEAFVPKKKNDSDETLEGFVTRRFGRELLEMIAEPLIAGIHSGDPEKMSVQSTFPRFHQMEKDYGSLTRATLAARKKMREMMKKKNPGVPERSFFISFKNGMYELVEKMLEKLKGENISTGKEVTSITKDGSGRFMIKINGSESIIADSVIVTTPAYVSSTLLKDLNGKMSNSMELIPYIKSCTISIVYKKSDIENRLPRAFGFLVPSVERRNIMAATFTSLKWPNRCPDEYIMLRCFVGGKHRQEYVEKDDKTLIKIVRDELKSIIGIEAEPVKYRIFRWINNMPQYNMGHRELIDIIDKGMSENRGLYVTGSAYKGIGIPDCINNAEITAKRIVEEILS